MKQVLLWLFILHSLCLYTQRTVRCLVLNHSYDPPRPEKFAKLTPLNGGHTLEQGTETGLFELKISGIAAGKPLELILSKEGYQILGPNPTIFTYAMPADESDVIRIAIIKSSDFDSRKADYEKAIDKRIKQANQALLDSITLLQNKTLNQDERAALTKFIAQQNIEIEELRKSKNELATRLAQVDLDQASDFARLALKKFRDEGDVKAALAFMPDEKLHTYWESVLTQEEKVRRARQQGVENYMIRARLLIADFQFPLAYENYLEAVEKDSINLGNLWEVGCFFDAQNQYRQAIGLYERALNLANTDAERSTLLNSLGNVFSANQKMGEAEKAYLEALNIYRQLVTKNTIAFLSDLATTLNNLGLLYNDNHRMSEAEKAYLEALNIQRQLATKNPDAFLPNLAMTLNNLGNLYSDNQQLSEAEKAYLEALSIRRQMVAKNPDAFLPSLAMALNNLGNLYRANQKMSEAERVYVEALNIRRQLVAQNPDAFLPALATTLNDLGALYYFTQKMTEAEKTSVEALSIQRKLVAQNPDAFLPDLAATLNNLGNLYNANQKMEEAERVYVEALSIRRQMAIQNPDAFLPDVAMTLKNLGVFYRTNQKMPEAEKVYADALSIYRQIVAQNPETFLPDLASTLSNLGEFYYSNHKMPEAEKAYLEALKIQRQMATQNSNAFLPDLAMTLNNLGIFYSVNQKMSEAEKIYVETLSIYRQLAAQNPDVFLPDVAMTLNNIGTFYKGLRDYSRTLKQYEEALRLRQAALLNGQVHFLPKWAQVVNNISAVKDSTLNNKDYINATWAARLMAESCDSLQNIDLELKSHAIREYGSLSRWALFARDYPLAERAARRCLELDPERVWVQANLGHAQLLQGNVKKAKEAYHPLKGKLNGSKSFKTTIEEDFEALEAENITHPGMAEIRKWLREEW